MATPLTPQRLIDALKAEGVPVREYPGWRDRCRCHNGSHERGENPSGRPWGPTVGTLVHKTAGDLGSRTVEKYILDIIIAATTDTPNKAQFVIAPNGDCWIVSAGRCNHDGQLGRAAHDAFVAGSWSLTKAYDPRQGNELVGNTYLYGIENITSTVPNSAQRDTSVRICAAISRAFGWTGADCAGHGEVGLDRGFTDPQLDMGAFRRDVVARVAANPNQTPPPPPSEEDFLMALTDTQQTDLYQTVKNIEKALQYPGAGGKSWSEALANQANDERKVIDAIAAEVAKDDTVAEFDQEKLQAAIEAALLKVAGAGLKADVTLSKVDPPA